MSEKENKVKKVSGIIAFSVVDTRSGKEKTQNFSFRYERYIPDDSISIDQQDKVHDPWTIPAPVIPGYTPNKSTITLKWFDSYFSNLVGPETIEAGYYSTSPLPGDTTGIYNYDYNDLKYTVNSDYTGVFPSFSSDSILETIIGTDGKQSASTEDEKIFAGELSDAAFSFDDKDNPVLNPSLMHIYKYNPDNLSNSEITPSTIYYYLKSYYNNETIVDFLNTNELTDYASLTAASLDESITYNLQKIIIPDDIDSKIKDEKNDGIDDVIKGDFDIGLDESIGLNERLPDAFQSGDPDFADNGMPDNGNLTTVTAKEGFEHVFIVLGKLPADGSEENQFDDYGFDNFPQVVSSHTTEKPWLNLENLDRKSQYIVDVWIPKGNDQDKELEFPISKIDDFNYSKDTIKLKYIKNPFYDQDLGKYGDEIDDMVSVSDGEISDENSYYVWTNCYDTFKRWDFLVNAKTDKDMWKVPVKTFHVIDEVTLTPKFDYKDAWKMYDSWEDISDGRIYLDRPNDKSGVNYSESDVNFKKKYSSDDYFPRVFGFVGKRYRYNIYDARSIGWLRNPPSFEYAFVEIKTERTVDYPIYRDVFFEHEKNADGSYNIVTPTTDRYYSVKGELLLGHYSQQQIGTDHETVTDVKVLLKFFITGTNFEFDGIHYYSRMPYMPATISNTYVINYDGKSSINNVQQTIPTTFPDNVVWVNFNISGAAVNVEKLPYTGIPGDTKSLVDMYRSDTATSDQKNILNFSLQKFIDSNGSAEPIVQDLDKDQLEAMGLYAPVPDSTHLIGYQINYTSNSPLYFYQSATIGKIKNDDAEYVLYNTFFTRKISSRMADSTGTFLSDYGKVKYSDTVLPQNVLILPYTISDLIDVPNTPLAGTIPIKADSPLWMVPFGINPITGISYPNSYNRLFLLAYPNNYFIQAPHSTDTDGGGGTNPSGNTVAPYSGNNKNTDLTILSQDSNKNKWRDETTLDLSGRVLDCRPVIKSDIRYATGREEVIVTIQGGTYDASDYDILVPSAIAGAQGSPLTQRFNREGNYRVSNMSPFSPYIGYYEQNYPLFLESTNGNEYTFVNLVGLVVKKVRQKDTDGSGTYDWLKSSYNDFLRSHSSILCYFLGINDTTPFLTFDILDPEGNNWRGAPVVQDDTSVVDASSVLQTSIQAAHHGNYIREGFMIDSNGKWTYYTSVYYDRVDGTSSDAAPTDDTRLITYIDLQHEHVLQLTKNSRNFGENPKVLRVYIKDPSDQDVVHFDGYYAINRNGLVTEITPNTTQYGSQSAILDIIKDDEKTTSLELARTTLKHALYGRNIDLSVVIDLTNRYGSLFYMSSQYSSPRVPFLQTYGGWVECDISDNDLPIILQLQQIDFVKNTALLATNNDIVLKERVR
jgi:hypothetical protein